MSRSPHDEFLELCAVSTSGQLTREEKQRLQEHLAVCPACREAMAQYDSVVSKTIPVLAPDPENLESDPSWSQDEAEAALFQRLALEEELGSDRGGAKGDPAWKDASRVPLSASQATCVTSGRFTLPAFCSLSLSVFPPIKLASGGV